MFSTLQAALGVWPSEAGYPVNSEDRVAQPSGVNETFTFDSEIPLHDAAQPTFVLNPKKYPSGKVFVPPYFVPPGVEANGTAVPPSESLRKLRVANGDHTARGRSVEQTEARRLAGINESSKRRSEDRATNPSRDLYGPAEALDASSDPDQGTIETSQVGEASRSPSPPPLSAELELQREAMWSYEARQAFHAMVTAPGYVNRYRLFSKKRERMVHYLQHPDLEPMNCDGTRDHQTKYQTANWTLVDGKLYRKPESGRVGKLRRHLDDFEAWDVLTTTHLRSGHLGRDKLRKVLERRYIGYTLQEIMFVLKECKRCAGKDRGSIGEETQHGNAIAGKYQAPDDDSDIVMEDAEAAAIQETEARESSSKGPYLRKQTSNMMWF